MCLMGHIKPPTPMPWPAPITNLTSTRKAMSLVGGCPDSALSHPAPGPQPSLPMFLFFSFLFFLCIQFSIFSIQLSKIHPLASTRPTTKRNKSMKNRKSRVVPPWASWSGKPPFLREMGLFALGHQYVPLFPSTQVEYEPRNQPWNVEARLHILLAHGLRVRGDVGTPLKEASPLLPRKWFTTPDSAYGPQVLLATVVGLTVTSGWWWLRYHGTD